MCFRLTIHESDGHNYYVTPSTALPQPLKPCLERLFYLSWSGKGEKIKITKNHNVISKYATNPR